MKLLICTVLLKVLPVFLVPILCGALVAQGYVERAITSDWIYPNERTESKARELAGRYGASDLRRAVRQAELAEGLRFVRYRDDYSIASKHPQPDNPTWTARVRVTAVFEEVKSAEESEDIVGLKQSSREARDLLTRDAIGLILDSLEPSAAKLYMALGGKLTSAVASASNLTALAGTLRDALTRVLAVARGLRRNTRAVNKALQQITSRMRDELQATGADSVDPWRLQQSLIYQDEDVAALEQDVQEALRALDAGASSKELLDRVLLVLIKSSQVAAATNQAVKQQEDFVLRALGALPARARSHAQLRQFASVSPAGSLRVPGSRVVAGRVNDSLTPPSPLPATGSEITAKNWLEVVEAARKNPSGETRITVWRVVTGLTERAPFTWYQTRPVKCSIRYSEDLCQWGHLPNLLIDQCPAGTLRSHAAYYRPATSPSVLHKRLKQSWVKDVLQEQTAGEPVLEVEKKFVAAGSTTAAVVYWLDEGEAKLWLDKRKRDSKRDGYDLKELR